MLSEKTSQLKLIVMSGPAQGSAIALDHSFLLGRDKSSRIPLDDERVSRHHAMVESAGGRAVIRDLDSKNGTFVNGVEIKEPWILRPDDRIRLGQTLLAVTGTDNATPTPAPGRADEETDVDFITVVHPPSPLSPETPLAVGADGIRRQALRRGTQISQHIGVICQNRKPGTHILEYLADQFHATNAAVFRPRAGTMEPAAFVGEDGFWEELLPEVSHFLHGDTFIPEVLPAFRPAVRTSAEDSSLIFFVRLPSSEPCVFLLHRHGPPPFGPAETDLAEVLSECLRIVPLEGYFEAEASPQEPVNRIIGSSQAMRDAGKKLRTYAATNATVLIVGESGTGKELFAHAMASLSPRANAPYVTLNAAAMKPELVESELFGHEQGAFTGAIGKTHGKLELAHGGTLFLDEIGELPLDLQAKLLRVLEGHSFYRLGGSETIQTDVRFICATNRNLEEMVRRGQFREDLYHRINILHLEVPPLRARLEDIPELVQHFLEEVAREMPGRGPFTLTGKALRRLLSHGWPGNVRELRNVLHRMAVLSPSSVLDVEQVPKEIGRLDESTTMKLPRLQMLTEMIEREEISRALIEAKGQKARAANLLGISRPTLDKKIKTYGLEDVLRRQLRRQEA